MKEILANIRFLLVKIGRTKRWVWAGLALCFGLGVVLYMLVHERCSMSVPLVLFGVVLAGGLVLLREATQEGK